MKLKLKIISLTAIGTTLFWVTLLTCLFWLGADTEHNDFGLVYHTNGLGVLWIRNSESQRVVAVVEDLGDEPTNFVAVGSAVLRRELSPGHYVRLGVRTMKDNDSER